MIRTISIYSRAFIGAASTGFIVSAGWLLLTALGVFFGFKPLGDFLVLGLGAAIGAFPVMADLIEERERGRNVILTVKRISISPGVDPGDYEMKAEG